MALLLPDYRFQKITEITAKDFAEMGIKAAALDVDNTLAPHNQPEPLEGVRQWLEEMQARGYRMVIVSNNKAARVHPFAGGLGLEYMTRAAKPLPAGFVRCAGRLGIPCRELAVIGDQIYTDILGANLCGAVSVLVAPVSLEHGWSFRARRRLEKPVLQRYERRLAGRDSKNGGTE